MFRVASDTAATCIPSLMVAAPASGRYVGLPEKCHRFGPGGIYFYGNPVFRPRSIRFVLAHPSAVIDAMTRYYSYLGRRGADHVDHMIETSNLVMLEDTTGVVIRSVCGLLGEVQQT